MGSGGDVGLEPLHRKGLDRAVGKGCLDRLVEHVAQVRIGLTDAKAFAAAEDRAADFRAGETERSVGLLKARNQVDGDIENEIETAAFEIEVALGAGLVFTHRGDIAEVVIDEL